MDGWIYDEVTEWEINLDDCGLYAGIMLLINIRCTSLNEILYVLNVHIATEISNSGEIILY